MSIARFGLLAVGIGATMAVIALIAGTAFFFRHHRSERASAQTAGACRPWRIAELGQNQVFFGFDSMPGCAMSSSFSFI